MHLVRAIALTNLGDPHAAVPQDELMVTAAARVNSPGRIERRGGDGVEQATAIRRPARMKETRFG